jgi:hypothetical protein
MSIPLIISFCLGTLLTLFGFWGTRSEKGKKKFDEMAGMIPFFSYYAGLLILAVSTAIFIL